VKLSILTVGPDGPARVSEDPADAAPPPDGAIRWIDVLAQDEPTMKLLGERFHLHPLAIEDTLHVDQRPKLEEYGDHLFIVTHELGWKDADPTTVEPHELHTFLGQRWVITVHLEKIGAVDSSWKRTVADPALARRGADFLFYLIADGVVDANFPLLDAISDELDDIETAVLGKNPTRADLTHIFELKRALVVARRVLSPQRDVFGLLAKIGDARIGEKTAFYFRDIYDHLVRIYESIDTARDLLGNALDAYLSMVAQRTNDIMKRLTLLSAVFLPITALTGFFGQNFVALPVASHPLFYIVCAACVAVPASMLVWFLRKGWFLGSG
jgi:magnesium transporter